jgi:hypothetical protein
MRSFTVYNLLQILLLMKSRSLSWMGHVACTVQMRWNRKVKVNLPLCLNCNTLCRRRVSVGIAPLILNLYTRCDEWLASRPGRITTITARYLQSGRPVDTGADPDVATKMNSVLSGTEPRPCSPERCHYTDWALSAHEYRIFFRNHQYEIPLGDAKRRWEDNIKMCDNVTLRTRLNGLRMWLSGGFVWTLN